MFLDLSYTSISVKEYMNRKSRLLGIGFLLIQRLFFCCRMGSTLYSFLSWRLSDLAAKEYRILSHQDRLLILVYTIHQLLPP